MHNLNGKPLVCASCEQSTCCKGCCPARFDSALLSHTIEEMTNRMIALALQEFGSATKAARKLGIGRATIYRWIKNNGRVA